MGHSATHLMGGLTQGTKVKCVQGTEYVPGIFGTLPYLHPPQQRGVFLVSEPACAEASM